MMATVTLALKRGQKQRDAGPRFGVPSGQACRLQPLSLTVTAALTRAWRAEKMKARARSASCRPGPVWGPSPQA